MSMNRTKALLSTIAACGAILTAAGQSFVNLDFEAAGTNTILPNAVYLSWSNAAPSWQYATVSSPFVYHGAVPTDGTAAYFLVDSNSTSLTPLAGNYSLALINGHLSTVDPTFTMTWIAQVGVVPANAESLTLLASGGPFTVAINGSDISLYSLGGDLYAGDVSAYEGQTVTLLAQNTSSLVGGTVEFDNFGFSPHPAPEPGSLALLACGPVLLLPAVIRRRKTRLRSP
jgi:hypothetical protein